MLLLEKCYDGESIYDLTRDVAEAIDSDYNQLVQQIPLDKNGFQSGVFRVKIEWVAQ